MTTPASAPSPRPPLVTITTTEPALKHAIEWATKPAGRAGKGQASLLTLSMDAHQVIIETHIGPVSTRTQLATTRIDGPASDAPPLYMTVDPVDLSKVAALIKPSRKPGVEGKPVVMTVTRPKHAQTQLILTITVGAATIPLSGVRVEAPALAWPATSPVGEVDTAEWQHWLGVLRTTVLARADEHVDRVAHQFTPSTGTIALTATDRFTTAHHQLAYTPHPAQDTPLVWLLPSSWIQAATTACGLDRGDTVTLIVSDHGRAGLVTDAGDILLAAVAPDNRNVLGMLLTQMVEPTWEKGWHDGDTQCITLDRGTLMDAMTQINVMDRADATGHAGVLTLTVTPASPDGTPGALAVATGTGAITLTYPLDPDTTMPQPDRPVRLAVMAQAFTPLVKVMPDGPVTLWIVTPINTTVPDGVWSVCVTPALPAEATQEDTPPACLPLGVLNTLRPTKVAALRSSVPPDTPDPAGA